MAIKKLFNFFIIVCLMNVTILQVSFATGDVPTPEELYYACRDGCFYEFLWHLADCAATCAQAGYYINNYLTAACIVGCLFLGSGDLNDCFEPLRYFVWVEGNTSGSWNSNLAPIR